MTARAYGLAEFHTAEEIRALWQRVLAASIERVAVNIHINASWKPDGRASSGITLTSEAEQEAFMADCRAALTIKANDATRGATLTDFSLKQIRA